MFHGVSHLGSFEAQQTSADDHCLRGELRALRDLPGVKERTRLSGAERTMFSRGNIGEI